MSTSHLPHYDYCLPGVSHFTDEPVRLWTKKSLDSSGKKQNLDQRNSVVHLSSSDTNFAVDFYIHWVCVCVFLCTHEFIWCGSDISFLRKLLMAVLFVPVPVPMDCCRVSRNSSKRGSPIYSNPLSRNCEPLPLENNNLGRRHRPCSAAVGWMAIVETWKRLRGDRLNGSYKPLEYEENSGESWEERSIATSLLGYEILEERAKFTVRS